MKRLIRDCMLCIGIFLIAGIFSITVYAENTEGEAYLEFQCGDDIVATLNENVLTLSGTGEMYDYSSDDQNHAPWYEYKGSIATVKIGEGITDIGDYAFEECAMKDIEFPSGLLEIGKYAFHKSQLTSVIIPEGVKDLLPACFPGCLRRAEFAAVQLTVQDMADPVGAKCSGGNYGIAR